MSLLLDIFFTSLRLGMTSFGGPIAHLGFFHEEFVTKKKWLSEQFYAELVGICQFLPGPASSQVGMAIGFLKGGIPGSILAWIGFTLPSLIILVLFGLGMSTLHIDSKTVWLHGLKIVAVSVVAHAVYQMAKKLCPDFQRRLMAILAALIMIYFSAPFIQVVLIISAALIGMLFLKAPVLSHQKNFSHSFNKKRGLVLISAFISLLIVLPVLRSIFPSQLLNLLDSFYRVGSLVFGGGHVVLPLLQAEVVNSGWVTKDLFMAGYGLAQAIPGPLFAFTGYLGAVSSLQPNGLLGALICLLAAFLPSYLLIIGVLPFWETLRKNIKVRQALVGINASVVGLLLAALYTPVGTSAIFNVSDLLIAAGGFLLLEFKKMSSWLVVILIVFAVYLKSYSF